jgi:hypothetical protein
MFDVTPNEIASLNDEDLRTLIGLLCEAEVAAVGLSRSHVTWGGNQDASDGGVDVQVDTPNDIVLDKFIPKPLTVFQSKNEDMPRSEILSEMRPKGVIRPVITELADKGGAYIIVSPISSTSYSALERRRSAMREALDGVANADQLHTDFYDRTRLASWVRSHPGIIAWAKEKVGRAVVGWQPFRNWSGGPTGEYILDNRLRLHFSAQKDTALPPAALSPEEGITKLRVILSQPKKRYA